MTDHDVFSNVVTILLAGEDTTANTLAWLIYLVSREPQVMRQMEEESDRLLGEAHWAARIDLATPHSYVAACAQETMRMKPVAPLLVFETVVACVVGDVALPAGAGVMLLMRIGTMSKRYFASEDFDPGR